MENLLTLLEEELNYSKKQSRNRINDIIKEADKQRLQVSVCVHPSPQGTYPSTLLYYSVAIVHLVSSFSTVNMITIIYSG